MDKLLDELITSGIDIGGKIIGVILILVIGLKLIKILVKILEKNRSYNKLEKSAKSFINSFINFSLKIILFITCLAYMGIPMTSMLALIGSAGLALGLALQGGLSNIASGLMILVFKPFKVGDFIDTHTDSGTVDEISIFHTILITGDNKKIVIPNGPLCNQTIINYSSQTKRRVDIDFSVGYDTDIDKVKKILENIINKHDLILKDEEIFIKLTKHDNSSLIFTTRAWVKKDDYWTVKFDLLETVKKEFDKNKINIPYPQLDVHLTK